MREPILESYARQSAMTSPGRHAPLLRKLPSEVADLARIIQQLVVYDVVAPDFYGFAVPRARQDEIHLRSVHDKLDALLALNDRPLAVARPVDKRLVGRCHHFALLLVAMLRAHGVPARARCGFGSYFNPPLFEDHWVCEYWNAGECRWHLADAQLDEVWRARLRIDHDVLNVPRDRFLVAGDAWTQCRTGAADPAAFGIELVGLRGLWYIAGSLVRDVAALNGMEMLPWDVWGAQPRPDEALDGDRLAFFDGVAALAREPDASFDELRAQYQRDARLTVPARVFNALRNRSEAVAG
jgi:hypothetical protein